MVTINKPDSLLATLLALGRFSLVVIGLIGLSVEIFRDNGWLRQLIAKMLDSALGLGSIPAVILVFFLIYFLNRWISTASRGKRHSQGDLPLYLMMIIGAFYLYMLITKGSF